MSNRPDDDRLARARQARQVLSGSEVRPPSTSSNGYAAASGLFTSSQRTYLISLGVLLVLALQVFLPHARDPRWQLALVPVTLAILCGALAICESLVAKMRILLVPRLLGVGIAAALLGIVTWLVEAS